MRPCDALFPKERERLGYDTCLACGEAEANQRRHTVVPMHKSNYTVISNPCRTTRHQQQGRIFPMNRHYYDIVNGDGDLIMEITSSFTNLTKDEYFNDI